MRLGIDAREIENGVTTGIGRPLANFLHVFSSSADKDDTCILFSSKPIPFEFDSRIRNIVVRETWRQYWDQIQLARAVEKEKIDILYSPYYKLPFKARCVCVCAVLDLMYLKVPEYRRAMHPLTKWYYFTVARAMVQKADAVLTCSEHSKGDIVELYKIKKEKIEVIPLSVGALYRPETDSQKITQMKARYEIRGPYLLYMGNFKPHKNVQTLIYAFKRIAERLADHQLVLAGGKTHGYEELRALAQELGLESRVVFPGLIREEDGPHVIYSGADCFVMPSLYEGFGLPPAEAMACGIPVVASKTTSIPEVVRDAGLLVDPLDAGAVAEAVLRICTDAALKERLIQKGLEYARAYDEQTIALQNYRFFKRTFKEHAGQRE